MMTGAKGTYKRKAHRTTGEAATRAKAKIRLVTTLIATTEELAPSQKR